MRLAPTIVILFISMTFFPIVESLTTETQFSDGTSSYKHTFTAQGGTVGPSGIVMPYGADVTNAEFTITGMASNEDWINSTTNSDFGGQGEGYASWTQNSYSGYRTSAQAENDQLSLQMQESTSQFGFGRSGDISSTTSYHNTTGGFVANGDQGFLGVNDAGTTTSLSGGTWTNPGALVEQGSEIHVLNHVNGIYNVPTVYRWNSTTGQYIGTGSINYNTCQSTYFDYVYDATSQEDGTVWTVSHYDQAILKWEINGATWTCQQSWRLSNYNYPSGVSFDENGDMWVLVRDTSSSISYYVWKVTETSPNVAVTSNYLGTSSDISGSPSGLDVTGSRITINSYYSSQYSYHYFYDIDGIWVTELGRIEVPGGHYGLEKNSEGHIAFTCYSYSSSYCSGKSRKVSTLGLGVPFEPRTPSSSNGVAYGSITTLSMSISQITLTSGIGYVPSNSSIEYEISVDGGNTWKRANPGNTITFSVPGNQVTWRAWLNGTSTETPILDIVSLTYKATFSNSGYIRFYRSFWSNPQDFPVAATIWWNATELGGSNLDVRIQHGGGNTYLTNPGQTVTLQSSSYLYIYFYMYSSSNRMYSPVIDDLNILLMTNAPSQVEFDIGGDGSNEWVNTGTYLGTETISNMAIENAINSFIPGTGTGTVVIPVNISSADAGIVSIDSFRITYSMPTINLDMNYDENMILHERLEPYEVVTRHIIGETASGLKSVELTVGPTNSGASPIFTWLDGDIWATPHDPEDWIDLDAGSYSVNNNGILEIHWKFKVKTDFPESNNVRFRVSCTDSNDYTPLDLNSDTGVTVNHTFGLGWMRVQDNQGAVQDPDLAENSWVKAGETIYFQGQMWFLGTNDAPKDSAFDVRVIQGSIVQSGAYDEYNQNGTFYIPVTVPSIDVEEGLTYSIQTYHETNPEYVLPPDINWQRTLRVDATTPTLTDNYPKEASYETASVAHEVGIRINDAVGDPTELTLNYWVEKDHDTNRNGEAELEEYTSKIMYNSTEEDEKWFFSSIDDSRNPNMAKVSYFISGTDPAGNELLHYMGTDDDENPIFETKDFGFGTDTATWITRQDSEAIFTGIDWIGHEDNTPVYSGLDQSISLGLIDANTAIDFEYIKLIFDFEGPNPAKDRQTIAYSGFNDTFWSESDFIQILPSSHTQQILDNSQLPLIIPHFNFRFGWDWPDEQISDVSLHYKEKGRGESTIKEFSNMTFTVENDLVLNSEAYLVEDISEPRVGPIYQGSSVRSDDRLSFGGRVTYQNSDIAPPRNVGIQVEVFDGENYWSDGSLSREGEYNVEVSMLAASSLLSSETRTFLIGIGEIPGKGEDMTGSSVPTTLVLEVDHSAPRVAARNSPLDIIDISSTEQLQEIAVNFTGWEENDLTGSEQYVNWVIRDGSKTIYASSSKLGSIASDNQLYWVGNVDLTDGGILGICSQAKVYSVCLREGYQVGFWLTGYDSAGNEFQENSNSESDPIKELAEVSTDSELSWVYLGSTVAKIRVLDFRLDDNHVTPSEEVTLSALIKNDGASAGGSFVVDFQSINSDGDVKSFSQVSLTGIDVGEELKVITNWKAEEGVTKLRVVVDPDNQIPEVNKDDNSATHDVEVSGIAYTGWVDGMRENPLPTMGIIIFLIVLAVIVRISRKTSINLYDSIYDEVMFDEDDLDGDDEYEDDYE